MPANGSLDRRIAVGPYSSSLHQHRSRPVESGLIGMAAFRAADSSASCARVSVTTGLACGTAGGAGNRGSSTGGGATGLEVTGGCMMYRLDRLRASRIRIEAVLARISPRSRSR
jgi:hypothetical protein